MGYGYYPAVSSQCRLLQDGRLRTGDHILRIGETPTQGLASEQVVRVLQGCGSRIRMLIARDPLGGPHVAPPPPPAPAVAPVSTLPPVPAPSRRGTRMVSVMDGLFSVSLSHLPSEERGGLCLFQPSLDGYEIQEVVLRKKEGQSLGISIVGYNAMSSESESCRGGGTPHGCLSKRPPFMVSVLLHFRCRGGLYKARHSWERGRAEREYQGP